MLRPPIETTAVTGDVDLDQNHFSGNPTDRELAFVIPHTLGVWSSGWG